MKKFAKPFRLGKKQIRAILDAHGREVIVFKPGMEDYAKEYVDFLNNGSKLPLEINTAQIKSVADSFITFDDMYDYLIRGDFSVLQRQAGTNVYPQIGWMINSFLEKEEYEKALFLKELKLPLVTEEKLQKEKEILKNIKHDNCN